MEIWEKEKYAWNFSRLPTQNLDYSYTFICSFFLFEVTRHVYLFITYHELEAIIVQTGFQLLLHLLQSLKLMPVLSQAGIFWDGAWKLLEYLRQLNQVRIPFTSGTKKL